MSKKAKRKRAKRIGKISDLLDKLKSDIPKGEICWFRGQSKWIWKLRPSIARKKFNIDKEYEIITRFKQNAALLLRSQPSSPWEWLTVMQHHGVPTRLFDWSESPLVALFFSVYENFNEDASLWFLFPTRLNQINNIKPDNPNYIPSFENKEFLDNYTPNSLYSERNTMLHPIAVIGPRTYPRMQAQYGVFTVFHRDRTPIEDIKTGEYVIKYKVPKNAKRSILNELDRIKITKFSLFPELQSLGEMIKETSL